MEQELGGQACRVDFHFLTRRCDAIPKDHRQLPDGKHFSATTGRISERHESLKILPLCCCEQTDKSERVGASGLRPFQGGLLAWPLLEIHLPY